MEGSTFVVGKGASSQGALRRIPSLSSQKAGISWRFRTCRRTGTTLVGWKGSSGKHWVTKSDVPNSLSLYKKHQHVGSGGQCMQGSGVASNYAPGGG